MCRVYQIDWKKWRGGTLIVAGFTTTLGNADNPDGPTA